LTSRVTTTAGASLAAGPELAAIAKLAAADRSTDAEKLYGRAIDELLRANAIGDASEVADLAVFTTSRGAEELPALRERLHAEPGHAGDPEGARAAGGISGGGQWTWPLQQPREHARGRKRARAQGLRRDRDRRRAPRRAGGHPRREEQLQGSLHGPRRHPGRRA